MLGIIDDGLAVGKNADRSERNEILCASKLHNFSFFGVVIGEESGANFGIRYLKNTSLQITHFN